jgi:hypothetical protein
MKRFSAFRPALVVASLLALAACGPKEPPRQASGPDTPDPLGDTSQPSNGSSGSGSSSSNSGGSHGSGNQGDNVLAPPGSGGGGGGGKAGKGEAPQVASLGGFLEGLRWGMSHAEVTKFFTQTGGVLWKDYDEKLAKARVGPEQNALESERERAKAAFGRSYIEFGATPTGFDTTGIKNEYTYRNKESLMWIDRAGKKRYFFFINDRLWKMYDEVPLADDGPMGKAYLDAVNKLNAQFGVQGRVHGADPAKGFNSTTTDWKDGANHLRAVDRTNDHAVGIAIEDGATLSNLTALRPNQPVDPMAIDPSVTAVTKNAHLSDPNAPPSASASASAGKKGAPPPKKK